MGKLTKILKYVIMVKKRLAEGEVGSSEYQDLSCAIAPFPQTNLRYGAGSSYLESRYAVTQKSYKVSYD